MDLRFTGVICGICNHQTLSNLTRNKAPSSPVLNLNNSLVMHLKPEAKNHWRVESGMTAMGGKFFQISLVGRWMKDGVFML